MNSAMQLSNNWRGRDGLHDLSSVRTRGSVVTTLKVQIPWPLPVFWNVLLFERIHEFCEGLIACKGTDCAGVSFQISSKASSQGSHGIGRADCACYKADH